MMPTARKKRIRVPSPRLSQEPTTRVSHAKARRRPRKAPTRQPRQKSHLPSNPRPSVRPRPRLLLPACLSFPVFSVPSYPALAPHAFRMRPLMIQSLILTPPLLLCVTSQLVTQRRTRHCVRSRRLQSTNESDSDQPHPGTDAALLPLVSNATNSQQLNVTPPEPPSLDNNLDIVVPPTPTKVIPESETGGVTSSAVVPPGSTAEEVAHLRAQQAHEPSSGDESDGTSFTEDEEAEDAQGVDERTMRTD
jgi:hypothetical protein